MVSKTATSIGDVFPPGSPSDMEEDAAEGSHDMSVDALTIAGVNRLDAEAHVNAMLGTKPHATFMEVFG